MKKKKVFIVSNSKLINLILQFRSGNDTAFYKIANQFENMIVLYANRICRL